MALEFYMNLTSVRITVSLMLEYNCLPVLRRKVFSTNIQVQLG